MLKTSAGTISDMLNTVTLREVVARDWSIDRPQWVDSGHWRNDRDAPDERLSSYLKVGPGLELLRFLLA